MLFSCAMSGEHVGVPERDHEFEEIKDSFRQALHDRRVDDAERILPRIFEKSNDPVEKLYFQGQILEVYEQYQQAIEIYFACLDMETEEVKRLGLLWKIVRTHRAHFSELEYESFLEKCVLGYPSIFGKRLYRAVQDVFDRTENDEVKSTLQAYLNAHEEEYKKLIAKNGTVQGDNVVMKASALSEFKKTTQLFLAEPFEEKHVYDLFCIVAEAQSPKSLTKQIFQKLPKDVIGFYQALTALQKYFSGQDFFDDQHINFGQHVAARALSSNAIDALKVHRDQIAGFVSKFPTHTKLAELLEIIDQRAFSNATVGEIFLKRMVTGELHNDSLESVTLTVLERFLGNRKFSKRSFHLPKGVDWNSVKMKLFQFAQELFHSIHRDTSLSLMGWLEDHFGHMNPIYVYLAKEYGAEGDTAMRMWALDKGAATYMHAFGEILVDECLKDKTVHFNTYVSRWNAMKKYVDEIKHMTGVQNIYELGADKIPFIFGVRNEMLALLRQVLMSRKFPETARIASMLYMIQVLTVQQLLDMALIFANNSAHNEVVMVLEPAQFHLDEHGRELLSDSLQALGRFEEAFALFEEDDEE